MVVGLIILAVGVVLLCFGIWRRRVGVAPHCQRCGFELTGLVEGGGGAERVEKCPECGAGLGGKRAVARGRRERRRWALVVGAFLTVGGGGLSGWVAYRVLMASDWPDRVPKWWLVEVELRFAKGERLSNAAAAVYFGTSSGHWRGSVGDDQPGGADLRAQRVLFHRLVGLSTDELRVVDSSVMALAQQAAEQPGVEVARVATMIRVGIVTVPERSPNSFPYNKKVLFAPEGWTLKWQGKSKDARGRAVGDGHGDLRGGGGGGAGWGTSNAGRSVYPLKVTWSYSLSGPVGSGFVTEAWEEVTEWSPGAAGAGGK